MKSHWSTEEEADTASPLANIGRRVTKTSASAYSSIRSVSGSTFNSRNDAGHGHARAVAASVRNQQRPITAPDPIITISVPTTHNPDTSATSDSHSGLADDHDELDYVTVEHPAYSESNQVVPRDKASRVLGIKHRRSMEPIPASNRTSVASVRSAPAPDSTPASHSGPTLPLASLYVVSGLPKSPHTWTLADPDSVLGLHHTEGAVSRWWRPEVLGSTVSPGAGGGKKKRKGKSEDTGTMFSTSGHLSKQEVGKMLSKALKLSFTREVEIIASTLQPASTVHNFTFNLPAPSTPLAPTASTDLLRASVLSTTNSDPRSSVVTFPYPYADDPFSRHARPSSAFLGPPSSFLSPHGHGSHSAGVNTTPSIKSPLGGAGNTVTYHGVCLTVWSHADAERTAAIRRTLEASRARKESGNSLVGRRKSSRASVSSGDPAVQARRKGKSKGPWNAGTDAETDMEGAETDGDLDGGVSESDFEVASTVNGHGPGESTLFLPGDTVFWLPYALTLVSRFPIYDLMRDYLTLSWARFSKDVQSHTLQISKILSHPAPRPGETVRLDASSAPHHGGHASETSLEVVSRFPGGLDFRDGLVDVNFTMWPLFKCLNIDNILTICEIALSPTGRILFFSRHPAMLSIAVLTIKYLVELRGWNGIALSAVHSRDAKIYIDDPGPWIMGLATEARYSVRVPPEVCLVDLDINYLNCAAPPSGSVSMKAQRDKYRQRILAAFEPHYHPDHCVPSEFKEAFPAGRFRPVCKIQAKRGAASTAVADMIKQPEWWHSTKIIQAFDSVLQDKMKKPSLLKRISSFGTVRPVPSLSPAEQHIQHSIRKRAMAFVDARDDLETKIGRLSRRLNFLMTESDLWRDKFVTFEQYAEKLSVEANDLRAKINREQKESKRLSSMITMTTVEKAKLQNQLVETESAHKDALMELEKMKDTMERMEQERAEMIAEVEAQIERALASMAVDMDDSDYGNSRPSSRLSSRSAPSTLRRSGSRARPLRSFSTESTLTDLYAAGVNRDEGTAKTHRTTTVEEVEEPTEEADSAKRRKRFSATQLDAPQDGMNAVDEGISQKSDTIAQKVLDIQRKLESLAAADTVRRSVESRGGSDSEFSEATRRSNRHRRRGSKPSNNKHDRIRSAASSGRDSPLRMKDTPRVEKRQEVPSSPIIVEHKEPSPEPAEDNKKQLPALRKIPSDVSISALRPVSPSASNTPVTPSLTTGASIATDDEETDFQSAYSTSPRASYGNFENNYAARPESSDSEQGTPTTIAKEYLDDFGTSNRERASSTATAKGPTSPTRVRGDTLSRRGQ
ncbi:AEX-3 domain-containing protein [Irpex lacteus]|nr:AEX-3 domain-containing protein [Irpex lacteus]